LKNNLHIIGEDMRFDETTRLKNLKMNKDVYQLRRRVMDLVYEARELKPLPRITIRITDDNECLLGLARMGGNIIWIPKIGVNQSKNELRHTVYHEILHTVYGVGHHNGDKLMHPVHKKGLSKKECEERFLYWANKAERGEKV
jgi:hypothetical protein